MQLPEQVSPRIVQAFMPLLLKSSVHKSTSLPHALAIIITPGTIGIA